MPHVPASPGAAQPDSGVAVVSAQCRDLYFVGHLVEDRAGGSGWQVWRDGYLSSPCLTNVLMRAHRET